MNDSLEGARVINIEKENDPGIITLQLMASKRPEDESILHAFAALEQTESVETTVGNIAALIARQILKLGNASAELVMPMTALVRRNMTGQGWEPAETDTLAKMRINLEEGNSPGERMAKGIALGDRALHFRAGITGNRHFKQPKGYADTMAAIGYEAALEVAKRTRESHVKPQIEPLLQKFAIAVAVMRALMNRGTPRSWYPQ